MVVEKVMALQYYYPFHLPVAKRPFAGPLNMLNVYTLCVTYGDMGQKVCVIRVRVDYYSYYHIPLLFCPHGSSSAAIEIYIREARISLLSCWEVFSL